ncbi:MAG: amidohydrolase family protein [Actinomycetota bacterium]
MTMTAGCDTHMHVYDGSYPAAPTATLHPPDASLEDYAHIQAVIGTERVVVVQPTTYGLDNSLHLAALAELGEAARGVMVINSSTDNSELRRLTDLGVRGARFHLLPGGAVDRSELEPIAARIAPFGWHIQLQLDGHELVDEVDRLRRLPCGLVIDHVGRFMPATPPDSSAFAALLALVDDGAHVKLSAPYESSPDPTHRYETVTACVDALVARAPDRLLWASNWPHPGQADPPDVEDLIRLRRRWLSTEALTRQVLIDNPATLYNF